MLPHLSPRAHRGLCMAASIPPETPTHVPCFDRGALLPLLVPHRVLNRDVTAYVSAQQWLPGPSSEHAAAVAAAFVRPDDVSDADEEVQDRDTDDSPAIFPGSGSEELIPTDGTESGEVEQLRDGVSIVEVLSSELSAASEHGWIDCLPWAVHGDPRCVTMHTRLRVECLDVMDALRAAPDVSSVSCLVFKNVAVTEELGLQLERLAAHLCHSARVDGAAADGACVERVGSDGDSIEYNTPHGAAMPPAFAGVGLQRLKLSMQCPPELLRPLFRVPSLAAVDCFHTLPFPTEPMPSLRFLSVPMCTEADPRWFGQGPWVAPDSGDLLFPALTDLTLCIKSKLLLAAIAASCPLLQHLSFETTASVPSSDVATLAGLPLLTTLTLLFASDSEPLRHDAAEALSTLHNLTQLHLRLPTPEASSQPMDAPAAPGFERSPLSGGPIGPSDDDEPFSLWFLPRLTQLRKLQLARAGDVSPVGQCVGLSWLILGDVKVSGPTAAAIGALPLTDLRVRVPDMDAVNFDAMFGQQLRDVFVRQPPRGLLSVCRCRGLQTVMVHRAKTLDVPSMSALGDLPVLQVVHLFLCDLSSELLCAFLFGEANVDAALSATGAGQEDTSDPTATDVSSAVSFAARWATANAERLQKLQLLAMPGCARFALPDVFLLCLAHLPAVRTLRFSSAFCSDSALLAFAETVDPFHFRTVSVTMDKTVLSRAYDIIGARRAEAAEKALLALRGNRVLQ